MWTWLESNLKVTDVPMEENKEKQTDDLVEKILNHMKQEEKQEQEEQEQQEEQEGQLMKPIEEAEAEEAEAEEVEETEEAEWEKELDRKWERECSIKRSHVVALFVAYFMNMFLLAYNMKKCS